MDEFTKKTFKYHIDKTIENLKKNNMDAYYAPTKEDALQKAASFLKSGDSVSVGGSMTLFEIGLIDYLKGRKDINFLDRYKEGLSNDDIQKIYRDSYFADDYFVSSNAITEDGELYNVDGAGNRVSAMIFGPKNVIVIAGYNKLVKDRDAAIERVKSIAAPANAMRLSKKTPCTKTGYCMDCASDDRICCDYVLMGRQRVKNRIKVIIVGEELGY